MGGLTIRCTSISWLGTSTGQLFSSGFLRGKKQVNKPRVPGCYIYCQSRTTSRRQNPKKHFKLHVEIYLYLQWLALFPIYFLYQYINSEYYIRFGFLRICRCKKSPHMLRSDHRGLRNRDLKLMGGWWWVYRAKAITASAQPTAYWAER